jgi:copper resistance protein C
MIRILLLVAVACLISVSAFAHATLDRASPPVGSEVSGAPASLSLTYTEPIEPLFSTVRVTDAKGQRVDSGKPTFKDDDRMVEVPLKPLQPGVYSVEWHVTSVDTHKTQGHFAFTVKP